jgi:hypothetical protein
MWGASLTVQMDHIDWGFRISAMYGSDTRYTGSYGVFSSQLLYDNHFSGYDMRWSMAKCMSPA